MRWVREELPLLPDPPLWVMQQAGEILYLPNGWHHATINLDPFTVAVGYADPKLGWIAPDGYVLKRTYPGPHTSKGPPSACELEINYKKEKCGEPENRRTWT